MSRLTLAPDEVHVWHAAPEQLAQPEWLAHYESLLSGDERERQRRFVRPIDALHYLVAHALVRTSLSQYADVAPQDWRFEANQYGAADFILTRMRTKDGRLLRTWSAGSEPKLNAYLEDYSFLLDGLVSLYEATFAPRWIEAALDLAEMMVDQFWDTADGGFFYTGRNHEALIARGKDPHDNAIPSGNAMAVTALLRLVKLTGRMDLQEKAEATLRLYRGLLDSHPLAAGQMLLALDFHLGPVQEIALVGDPSAEDTRRVLRIVRGSYRPHQVVALKAPGSDEKTLEELLPLLAGKTSQGAVTVYVCHNFTCQTPLVGVEAAEAILTKPSTTK